MSQVETWTIGRLLTWTVDYLKERGIEGARLDAEVLLAAARGCGRIDLYAAYTELADEETRVAFRELVRRRAEGTPVAYLVGRREFYSMDFRVTPDVLIPRPETEFLVIALLDDIKEQHGKNAVKIADVGTGSGNIAAAAAKHCLNCRITAIDRSPAALQIAAENARTHGVENRIQFVQSDLFADVAAEALFDYIVSNPPYVSTSEMKSLPPEIRHNEPEAALHAGPRGTEIIERLLIQAVERLTPGGTILIEISPMIEEPVAKLIEQQPHLKRQTTIKDLSGLTRVAKARKTEA